MARMIQIVTAKTIVAKMIQTMLAIINNHRGQYEEKVASMVSKNGW